MVDFSAASAGDGGVAAPVRAAQIALVGDVSLHQDYDRHLEDPSRLMTALSGLWPAGVPVIANLEAPLTFRKSIYPGKASLRANPRWAALLKEAGVVAVSLGNNHIMDSGADGLDDTCRALDEAGIMHTGAGPDVHAARTPVVLAAGDLKVGLLSYNAVPVRSPIQATERRPGVVDADIGLIAQDIAALRTTTDHILVALHWGLERYQLPTAQQRRLARAVIERGADAVVGHHPHILQGVEWISDRPVLYSLGNFLFSPLTWTGIGSDGEAFTETLPVDADGRAGVTVMLSLRANASPTADYTFSYLDEDLIPRDRSAVARVVAARSRKLGRFYPVHWQLEDFRIRLSSIAQRFSRKAAGLKRRILSHRS